MGKRLVSGFDTALLLDAVRGFFGVPADAVTADEVMAAVYGSKDSPAPLWGVAVSGGSDSVALLVGLVKAGLGGQIIVLHMNHGWGEDDGRAEACVESLCDQLDVSLLVGEGNGLPEGGSVEAVARRERQMFFAEQVRNMGLAGVLLGHHADDLLEHVVMRLARGSGLQGLVGLAEDAEVEGVRYARPLLAFRKETLRTYLKREGVSWQDDAVADGLRVRLRAVLPQLIEAGFDVEAVLGSVEALRDAEEVVRARVEELTDMVEEDGEGCTIPLPQLVLAEREVGARLVGWLIAQVTQSGEVIRRGKRVALWERMAMEPQGVGELGGARFVWGKGVLRCSTQGLK